MEPRIKTETIIVPFGVFPHPMGEQVVDRPAAERILARMGVWSRDIVVDYAHESLKDCGRATAAGWVKTDTAKIAENGVTAVIEWTDEAGKAIGAGEFRFLSPVFILEGGRIAGLLNLGLTNNPNIHSMPALSNQLSTQETRMKKDVCAVIKELLKLPPDTPDDAVVKAVEVLIAQPSGSLRSALGDAVAMLGLGPDATDEQIVAKIGELAAKSADAQTATADTMVNDAVAAGRLAPSLKGWARDLAGRNPESLRVFIANSVPAIPLGGLMTPCVKSEKRLTESQDNVCRLMGVSGEDYRRYGN
jgi:phage I-like protein